MAIYSEVVMGFSEQAKAFMLVLGLEFPGEVKSVTASNRLDFDNGNTAFYFREIAWVERVHSVKMFMNIMDMLDEYGYDHAYCFGRLANHWTEPEFRGCLNEGLGLNLFQFKQIMDLHFSPPTGL